MLGTEETDRLFVGDNILLRLYVIRKISRASEVYNKSGGSLEGREAVFRDRECCEVITLNGERPHIVPSRIYGIKTYSLTS